jgi:hypothetical protein
MARLVTIGDSISQGFMSAGAARTELSYSARIADCLGLTVGQDYHYPHWPMGGIPLNMEVLLRNLSRYYGNDIWGPFEWSSAMVRISSFMDRLEDYYERGEGDYRRPYIPQVQGFHNLASFGLTVSDAWQLTPVVCLEKLEPHGRRPVDDEWFGQPSDAFYRSAFRVLNPNNDPARQAYSALTWLEHYAEQDQEGVENLILWLGANNALGTVLHMDIREVKLDLAAYRRLDHYGRGPFNLWDPRLFRNDYQELLERIATVLNSEAHRRKQPDWRVFVGNVPPVTVAPVTTGVGRPVQRKDPFGVVRGQARYYEYYVYFVFDYEHVRSGRGRSLSVEDAYYIDERIASYNENIQALVKDQNRALGSERFILVDTARALIEMAYKRNHGHPTYTLPAELQQASPVVTTQYYRAANDRVTAGGIFSLDGVHPSAIGHGIIAHEFLNAMKKAGRQLHKKLDWAAILETDELFSRPLNLVEELFQHDRLASLLLSKLRTPPQKVDAAG